MKRKDFIKKASIAAVGSGLILQSCNNNETASANTSGPAIITDKKYKWKLVTTWPPNFPVLGEGCNMLAEWIKTMSGGRMEINVYGGGELVPPLESFEAVSSGAVEMGHGAAYYWAGKSPALQFFTTIPFGLNAQQIDAWMYSGGGLELWEENYARFGLVPFPAGNTGVQMAGWFNKEINSIEDFKGLKMRIPGLGGKVLKKAGGTAVLSAGSEIYTNLERGVIDATEWIGPYHDYKMGFHNIAKYYYAPGWHEPGPILDLFVNKRAFEGLSIDLQEIIRTAAYRLNAWATAEFEAQNNFYLRKLIEEEGVDVRRFSDEVLAELRKYSEEVIQELIAEDEASAKVYASLSKFTGEIRSWSEYSEKLYYNSI